MLSYYDILNRHPLISFGRRRLILLLILAIAFLAVGFGRSEIHWARWTGVMIGMELILRILIFVTWKYLPRTAVGKMFIDKVHMEWPMLRTRLSKARETRINIKQERIPYAEEQTMWLPRRQGI